MLFFPSLLPHALPTSHFPSPYCSLFFHHSKILEFFREFQSKMYVISSCSFSSIGLEAFLAFMFHRFLILLNSRIFRLEIGLLIVEVVYRYSWAAFFVRKSMIDGQWKQGKNRELRFLSWSSIKHHLNTLFMFSSSFPWL